MITTEIRQSIVKKTLGLTLAFTAAAMAFAQQEKVAVSGTIVDKKGAIVPYTSITFINKADKALSDANLSDDRGIFSLNLTPGAYTLKIEAPGFKDLSIDKTIASAGNIGNLTIEELTGQAAVDSKTQNIQGVTITAQSAKPYKVELDKKTYNPSTDLISKGGNLQDVLTNVPSVTVDTDGTVSMRGSSNIKFLVNGKPSALLGIDDGADALQSIPADQIERIEVITNPSSKFEASGTSGILNIILKKSNKVGFNGSVVGTLGYLPRTSLNTNLSWRKNKLTFFMNGGGGYRERDSRNDTETTYNNVTAPSDPSLSALVYQSQNSKDGGNFRNYNFNTGIVYDISDKTSFNISGMVRNMDGESDATLSTIENRINSGGSFQNSSSRITNGDNTNLAFQGDLGLDHKFDDKGQNISVSLSLQHNKSKNNSNIEETSGNTFISRDTTHRISLNKSLIGKIDYELPIGENSKLEAGYRLDVNQNNYDGTVKSTISNSLLPNYNNSTYYREMFNSVYVQFKSKIGNFGYQLGLRNENSDVKIDYSNLANQVLQKNKKYNDLFPSVYLSYDVANNNQILVNYSRRIDRPRSFFMVPFSNYSNNQNIFEGNIDLNPSYVDSYELGYAIQKRKLTINPTLYYRHATDDDKMLVYRPDERENVFYTKPINLGSNDSYGLDLNFSYDPLSWLKIMGNIDLFGYKTKGIATYDIIDKNGNPGTGTMDFTGSGFSTRARLNTTFKIDKTFSFQLQGMFRGGRKTANQETKDMYGLNLGASKTIWKGNGTLSFNLQDVLNSRAHEVFSYNSDYTRRSYMKWSPRQFSISLTYRFKQGDKFEMKKPKKDINNNYDGGDDAGQMGGGM
ncbi:TonB-dependent receptor domain-containing protein [Elizabethkingia sp. JS20170427COW]|uniref:TonB-dependent receptor domain-containing protein n=1 Tax=Elizabethkingia sp. JS20170427COW TaxID=2583851 RepID=UPI0011105537|nr:TonB-dependent receptor [Elizabethkingia sp. JS20170427COW]QCX53721.1 TonB-dependent receptor [Elizabethkingia sp. JS20170427COW]